MSFVNYIVILALLLIVALIANSYRKMILTEPEIQLDDENDVLTVGPSHLIVMDEETDTPVRMGDIEVVTDFKPNFEPVAENSKYVLEEPNFEPVGTTTSKDVLEDTDVTEIVEPEVSEPSEPEVSEPSEPEVSEPETVEIVADEIVVNEVKPVQE